MAIYNITNEALVKVSETRFDAEGMYERKDLQRLLRRNIEVLSRDLMVIAEEFGDWVDSTRRIDLLCLDKEAALVVIELKRGGDAGHMDLQAIRYAAMVSAMTFDQLVTAHAGYLGASESDAARTPILKFLGWSAPDDDLFAREVKIILAAADFSKELTTSVMWLNQQGLDIRCMRLKPYRLDGATKLLDVQQIIPLPEATEFQTQIRAKEQAGRMHRTERHDLRYQFWSALLQYARTKTDLHANRNPVIYGAISGPSGKAGINLNYVTLQHESRVEVYINTGDEDKNLRILQELKQHQQAIESEFGQSLEWQELPDSSACRICVPITGGYRDPADKWPSIHVALVDAMIKLAGAFRPYIQKLGV